MRDRDDMEAYKSWADLYPEEDAQRRMRRDKIITELKACEVATENLNRQLNQSLSTLAFIWEE
jgi:hypothetical protein